MTVATATTGIYTLSLHDALPIWAKLIADQVPENFLRFRLHLFFFASNKRNHVRDDIHRGDTRVSGAGHGLDPKSTRLNSSHSQISYAAFCVKRKPTHACPAACLC